MKRRIVHFLDSSDRTGHESFSLPTNLFIGHHRGACRTRGRGNLSVINHVGLVIPRRNEHLVNIPDLMLGFEQRRVLTFLQEGLEISLARWRLPPMGVDIVS